MPDAPPTDFDRIAALRIAQQLAFENAHAAQQHYGQAVERTEHADARTRSDYLRQAVAEARQTAQRHEAQTTEHARLAEVWATVATALAAGTDGRPATYDLTVQVDPKGIGEELQRQLRQYRRPEGT
ncbi:hypothetical protein [Streptomyces antibioticus]|uniref:hypothetical protein n=1 Tax=Streptomyces antibioticus TaxID=1890 RepID=UPI0033ADA3E2